MKQLLAAIALLGLLHLGGCQWLRQCDQWKCDHLGICLFGVRPSCEQCPPCDACCPPADGPIIVGPELPVLPTPQ
jgi:hypothetical protein